MLAPLVSALEKNNVTGIFDFAFGISYAPCNCKIEWYFNFNFAFIAVTGNDCKTNVRYTHILTKLI